MSKKVLVISIVVMCLLIGVLGSAAGAIELKDPDEFKGEVLAELGVSLDLHLGFAAALAEPARPFEVELDRPVVIGFATPSFDISDAWARWYWSTYYRLEEAGVPFEMNIQATSRHDAHDEQLAQIESLIASEVDFIIMGPTELDAQRVAVRKAHEAGIPIIILNFSRPFEGDESTLLYAAFDHEFGGYLSGIHIAEQLGGQGKMAGLRMIPGSLDNQRWGGMKAVIDQTDIEIVYETYAEANRQIAYEATMDIMTAHPDLAAIYATSTAMALGAASALETVGMLDQVAVYGFGGTVDEIDAMLKGRMVGSVFRFQDDAGAAVGEAIQRYLEGRADEVPMVYMGDMVMAHSGMTEAQFRELAERGMRYSQIEMGLGM